MIPTKEHNQQRLDWCLYWWLGCTCQWPSAHKGYVRSLYWPFHSYKMDSTVLDIQEKGQGKCCTDHFQKKGKQQWNLRFHSEDFLA